MCHILSYSPAANKRAPRLFSPDLEYVPYFMVLLFAFSRARVTNEKASIEWMIARNKIKPQYSILICRPPRLLATPLLARSPKFVDHLCYMRISLICCWRVDVSHSFTYTHKCVACPHIHIDVSHIHIDGSRTYIDEAYTGCLWIILPKY